MFISKKQRIFYTLNNKPKKYFVLKFKPMYNCFNTQNIRPFGNQNKVLLKKKIQTTKYTKYIKEILKKMNRKLIKNILKIRCCEY